MFTFRLSHLQQKCSCFEQNIIAIGYKQIIFSVEFSHFPFFWMESSYFSQSQTWFVQMFRKRKLNGVKKDTGWMKIASHCHDMWPQTVFGTAKDNRLGRLFFSLSQIHTHTPCYHHHRRHLSPLIRIKVACRRLGLLPQPSYQGETGRPREIPPTPERSDRTDQSAALAVRRSRRAGGWLFT